MAFGAVELEHNDIGECIHFGEVGKDGIELVRTSKIFESLMGERKEACPGLVVEPHDLAGAGQCQDGNRLRARLSGTAGGQSPPCHLRAM